jgi:hypothetical protein
MPSTVFQGLTVALFQGDSSPLSVISNNPAFGSILVASAAPPAQNALASLALDLTGGRELTQLTSGMILTNILGMLRLNNSKAYTVIKVIGPCIVFIGGVCQFTQRMTIVSVMAKAAVTSLTNRVTASVVVPADTSLNRDVMAWLAARASQSMGMDSRALTVTTDDDYVYDTENWESQVEALAFIPSFGD